MTNYSDKLLPQSDEKQPLLNQAEFVDAFKDLQPEKTPREASKFAVRAFNTLVRESSIYENKNKKPGVPSWDDIDDRGDSHEIAYYETTIDGEDELMVSLNGVLDHLDEVQKIKQVGPKIAELSLKLAEAYKSSDEE